MSQLTGTPVLILREGAERSRGKDAQSSNIMAAKVIAESIRSSLGPKGLDKMLVDSFGDVTITNDGATMLKEMDVQHPAAKMLIEIAKTQDDEVGDGTTSAVILAGEFLKNAEELIKEKIHPTVIVEGYRKATEKALQALDAMATNIGPDNRDIQKKAAITAIASKVVSGNSAFLADIAVNAINMIKEQKDGKWEADLDNISVQKKQGESVEDSNLISGLIIDKEIVHSGMPKTIKDAKIALLEAALEIEKTEFDAKVSITQVDQMQAFLSQEEGMLRKMAKKVQDSGATVVLCQKGIDDMVQHFLSKAGIAAIRRIKKSDMEKLAKATGAKIITNLETLTVKDLGTAGLIEERRIGNDLMVFVEQCSNTKAISILLRGGTQLLVDEADRALHDALCVVRNLINEPKAVVGGGASEVEVAKELRAYAATLSGREQLAVQAFAKAMEVIPRTLAENAGLDPIDILVEIRSKHGAGQKNVGVDVMDGKVGDLSLKSIWEPLLVKKQAIKSASEASQMILRIDDVISSGKGGAPGGPPGRGGPPGGGEED
ncbi:MAG: TCP-1/cpn60 chaperonin family protein [Candidatus Helarchaeota archaeon]|nr:TCP-1/cpn60 chaperonin family protein [Candidatus Helarchaeota archaeon]